MNKTFTTKLLGVRTKGANSNVKNGSLMIVNNHRDSFMKF